jgi:EpsI family protein
VAEVGALSYAKSIALAAILLGQAAVVQFVANGPRVRLAGPLSALPLTYETPAGRWAGVVDTELSAQEAEVLKADATLLRTFRSPRSESYPLTLLVAYFEAQVEGRSPHSPKNCLPGSGWEPVESSIVNVAIPATGEKIPVNRYLLAKDEGRILMFYWYQSSRRAIASEYAAKLYLVRDALLLRRTENAIVRLSVPLRHAADQQSEDDAIELIRSVYPAVREKLPATN